MSLSYKFLAIEDHGPSVTVMELCKGRPIMCLPKEDMVGDKWNVYIDGELYEG